MIWTLAFWKGAGERAVKTFAQTIVATIGVNTALTLGQVNWLVDASVAAVATVLSLFTSIGNASFTAGAIAQAKAAMLSRSIVSSQSPVVAPVQLPPIPLSATPPAPTTVGPTASGTV